MTRGERANRDDQVNSSGYRAQRVGESTRDNQRHTPTSSQTANGVNRRQQTHHNASVVQAGVRGERKERSGQDTDDGQYHGPSAPSIVASSWKRRLYIDRPADLAALAAELMNAHVVAIDAEFSQVYAREPDQPSHRLALLQLAIDNDYRVSYVVDALRLADLSPLQAPLENPKILKLFHGIGADTRVLATRELVACHTLDLEAVSRSLFGQRESGLQAMLRRACNIQLDKSLQRADWSRRPLTPAMVAYAARDAEMTLVLYDWLIANYQWAVALHEMAADEPSPAIAPWILPYLEGGRSRLAAFAVTEAGIAGDVAMQRTDLLQALEAVRHPSQHARLMRLITDLDLTSLATALRPYLSASPSEERAGAARALGRLHDIEATPAIRMLLHDPVYDVRQAASLALENLAHRRAFTPRSQQRPTRAAPGSPVRWRSDETASNTADGAVWRAHLRASFGITPASDTDEPDAKS